MKIKIETYEDIYGAFDFEEHYDKLFWEIPENGIFIEVGCFAGKSTAYFAQLIKDTGKNITFATVDNFSEVPSNMYSVMGYQMQQGQTVKDIFIQNIKDLELENYVGLIEGESIEVAEGYPNELLDGVFIDGAHDYESIKQDIRAWLPKIKQTGFISGHDIDIPGVWKAVREQFGKFYVKNNCWFIKRGDNV